MNKSVTLIEYAAFYGSIQIFQYLQFNGVELKSTLWLFAIHSNNANLIHLLEEYHVVPYDKTYEKCFEESIKCHHNDVARYIQDNLLFESTSKNHYIKNSIAYGFHYNNYEFFPDKLNQNLMIFHYSCQYDYYTLVKILLQSKELNINETVIQKK